MDPNFLNTIVLPFSFVVIMFGMGLKLSTQDFVELFKKPKTTLIGVCCQIFLMPLLAFCLVKLFRLESNLAMGLMVVSLVPGAMTSNIMTQFARGNVALSIILTVIVTLLTPFTLPLMFSAATNHFSGNNTGLNLPFINTAFSIVGVTVFPLLIALFSKNSFSNLAEKCEKPIRIFSIATILLVVFGLLKENSSVLTQYFTKIGLVCVLFNVLALWINYNVATYANLAKRDAIAIAIECSFQNSAMALFITGALMTVGGNATIIPAIYSITMFATGGGLIWYLSNIEKVKSPEKAKSTQ